MQNNSKYCLQAFQHLKTNASITYRTIAVSQSWWDVGLGIETTQILLHNDPFKRNDGAQSSINTINTNAIDKVLSRGINMLQQQQQQQLTL